MEIKKNGIAARLLEYIRPYWMRLTGAMMFAGIVSLTTGSVAWLVKPILDDIFLQKEQSKLFIVPFLFVALYLIKGLARYGQTYLMKVVGLKVITKIRDDLYAHILRMPLSFYQNNPSAVLMSRVTNDVSKITEVATSVVAEFVRQVLTFIVLLGVILYQDWKLSLLALGVFPFVFLFIGNIGKKLKALSRKNQEKMADLNTILMETFTGSKIVKAFVMEDYEKNRFHEKNRDLYDICVSETKKDELVSPLMEFLGAVGAGLVMWYGGAEVIKGGTTPGTFFSFLAAITMMYEPIRKVSKMNNTLQQALAAGERIFAVLDHPVDIDDKRDALDINEFTDSLHFNNLSFRYTDETDLILNGINLRVKRGELIAVVGSSGAGKSTLMNMIPRYYDPEKGSILLDGKDIRDIKLSALRNLIGVVTQETILFNDTVRNNLAYGRKDADEADIIQAAKLAYAHNFISGLPKGYDTVIGERGTRLSGGERQRLSIARAILKNPAILLLDEATSNLDSESESLVQQALENLMRERTTVVIAHRLSTIVNADRIVSMVDGCVAEIGTHEELLKKGGIYRSLHDLQYSRENRKMVDDSDV